jgi:hypothetical protein
MLLNSANYYNEPIVFVLQVLQSMACIVSDFNKYATLCLLQKNGGTDTKAHRTPVPVWPNVRQKKKVFANSVQEGQWANNAYLMVRSRSEYYTSMSVSGLPTFFISVKNMNQTEKKSFRQLCTRGTIQCLWHEEYRMHDLAWRKCSSFSLYPQMKS